ncbi:MAG: hypothetical protein BWY88_01148 [Synergistetes bacterium ADurb.Bin520]|nr:MAG: hypothetical protein BWY88_01148 [Synergistetes bacterium ADurb.Bin520]
MGLGSAHFEVVPKHLVVPRFECPKARPLSLPLQKGRKPSFASVSPAAPFVELLVVPFAYDPSLAQVTGQVVLQGPQEFLSQGG